MSKTERPAVTLTRCQIEYIAPDALHLPERQLRRHSDKQLAKLAASISRFGMPVPIVIDGNNKVIDGVACVLAAQKLGLVEVPTTRITDLSDAELRVLRLALNRLPQLTDWDTDTLRIELRELVELDLDLSLELVGWDMAEIDLLIEPAVLGVPAEPDDEVPLPEQVAISRPGDVWQLGAHRLLCETSLDPDNWVRLMDGAVARMAFTDPPYNVPVAGHVSGLGKNKHQDFAMAAGEMSDAEFETFLQTALTCMAEHVADGGILATCMDWRGLMPLGLAARGANLQTINLCVWNKTNGGMGSLYRSKHEVILILKKGKAAHINNVQLGVHGRYRTNVWDYAGANSFGRARDADLADHPTVKPIALVADAIRDVSHRGDIVVDAFIGSGSTILAAERTGRRCFGIELDPRYVDVAIRRWERASGQQATLEASGLPFAEVAALRQPDTSDQDEPEGEAAVDDRPAPRIRHRAPPRRLAA